MATAVRQDFLGCEGFRVMAPRGLLGWVEETWLGPGDQPVAFAVRLTDGRDGLLLVEDVVSVSPEAERITTRPEARLLELDVPRLESTTDGLTASWHTTGSVLEPPSPPGLVTRLLLPLRPWRLSSPRRPDAERPLWVTLVLVYTALAVITGLLIGLDFLAAALAT